MRKLRCGAATDGESHRASVRDCCGDVPFALAPERAVARKGTQGEVKRARKRSCLGFVFNSFEEKMHVTIGKKKVLVG